VTQQSDIIFWRLRNPTSLEFIVGTNNAFFVDSIVPFALGETPWMAPPGQMQIPSAASIIRTRFSPNWERWIGTKNLDPTAVTAKLKRILQEGRATQFQSFKAAIRATYRPEYGIAGLVGDGVLLTEQGQIYFWSVFFKSYILLQNSDGRVSLIHTE